MNEKIIPPPPKLPPKIAIPKKICLLHKGALSDLKYTCPKCKTQYCLECAKTAKEEGIVCVKCKQLIIV